MQNSIATPGYTFYLAPPLNPVAPAVQLVAAAKKSIHVVAYSLTLGALTALLVAKHAAGLDVGLVLDLSQAMEPYEDAPIAQLKAAGVPVVTGSMPAHQIVHTKLVVVDGRTAWLGSANLTVRAATEANIAIVTTAKAVVAALEAYYQQLRVSVQAPRDGGTKP